MEMWAKRGKLANLAIGFGKQVPECGVRVVLPVGITSS